jgi:hypothetical protein
MNRLLFAYEGIAAEQENAWHIAPQRHLGKSPLNNARSTKKLRGVILFADERLVTGLCLEISRFFQKYLDDVGL